MANTSTQIDISFDSSPPSIKPESRVSRLTTPRHLYALFPQSPRLVDLMMFRYRFGLSNPGRTEQSIMDYYTDDEGLGEKIAALESAIVGYLSESFD